MIRIFLLSIFLMLSGATAHAQNVLRHEKELYEIPVGERIHPELQADGIAHNGFIYKPRLIISGEYNSNVRALKSTNNADYSLSTKPELYVQKNYNGHILNGFFGADIERFASLDDENHEDFDSYLRGHFDVSSQWSIPAALSYSRKAQPRDAPQSQSITKSPQSTNQIMGSAGITRHFNRLSLSLISQASEITHDDGRALIGGAPVIFSDQDRTNIAGIFRARYKAPRENDAAEHTAFLDLKYENQNYKNREYINGSYSGRSGDNIRAGAFAGFESAYKGLLFSNIGVGYMTVNYDDSGLKDTDLLTLGAEVSYMITPKSTLNFDARRLINQDNDIIQGYEETTIDAGIDYEARHNLYLGADAAYKRHDFIGSARADDNYSANIYMRYLNSHRLETHLGLGYFERDSTDQTQNYDRYRILLSLVGKI